MEEGFVNEAQYAPYKSWPLPQSEIETFNYGSLAESKSLAELEADEENRRIKQTAILTAEVEKTNGVIEFTSKLIKKMETYKDIARVIKLPVEIMIGQEPTDFVSDLSNNIYEKEDLFDVSSVDLSGAALFGHINKEMNTLYAELYEKKEIDEIIPIVGFSNDTTIYASIKKDLNWQISTPSVHRQTCEVRGFPPSIPQDQEEEDAPTDFKCNGCSKYFATKGSLKRHHERKQSCKEICEKKIEETFTGPYIVDWVETALKTAISGTFSTPLCKYCDIEFANKSNLNKHLSKSTACDTLAKRAFLELIRESLK
jgi:hypothetical protein